MKIKNIHSIVPSKKSISKIHTILTEANANNINFNNENGKCVSINFAIQDDNFEAPVHVLLEPRTEEIRKAIVNKYKRTPTEDQLEKATSQAAMTAWKILSDYVEIIITMHNLEQMSLTQMFLGSAVGKDGLKIIDNLKQNTLKLF